MPTDRAEGEPAAANELIPPQPAPMDDAAGGPQADQQEAVEDVSTDDLSVQGGD